MLNKLTDYFKLIMTTGKQELNFKIKKNMFNILCTLMVVSFANTQAYASDNKADRPPLPDIQKNAQILNNQGIDLNLENENKLKINVTAPPKKIDGKAFNSKEEMLSQYFQNQKKLDVDDIKLLWESTINRNPVIKFALNKLSSPPEQRRAHSSLMAKTVSSLISGVAMLPGVLGADSVTSSAASMGGTIANRVIASKTAQKVSPLTDTELIHLARLIEDLQDKTIKNYYEYKSNLEALKIARAEILKQNIAYSLAMRTNETVSIMSAKNMYDNAIKDEMEIKQKVKLQRLELERLAGAETLNNLQLGKIAVNNTTINQTKPANGIILPKLESTKTTIYNDKSINELSVDAGLELKDDQKDMLSDLSTLWNAAVERSETIRFAILKLSNTDAKDEKNNAVKNILSPLVNVASIIGVSSGDPISSTSAIFGGNFLNSLLSSDNAELNARLSKVTDTDLILLAQETDNLQQKLIVLYCNYTAAIADLNYSDRLVKNRYEYFNQMSKINPQLKTIANVFYQEALESQYKARQKMLNSRVALEQFVGNDAIISIDKNIKQRLSVK